MFEVGTRVEVYSISGTIAYVGVVTESGSSESCEGPDCSRCNRKMHTPVREDGVDYSMGIATSHVAREGTRADDEPQQRRRWCPYRGCTFSGTDAEVDDHRATGAHNHEPQAGSNR